MAFYRHVLSYISIGNITEFMCMVTSGVIQGCSLSGSLFAMDMNVFLALAHALFAHSSAGVIAGCAHDIGLVSNSLVHLKLLSTIFAMFSGASGLFLKPPKCKIVVANVPWSPLLARRVFKWLRCFIPEWQNFEVVAFAKYMGTLMGPDAGDHQRVNANQKVVARSQQIGRSAASQSMRTGEYRAKAFACWSYLLQFCDLPASIFNVERYCIS